MSERAAGRPPGVALAVDTLAAASAGLAATLPMSAVMLGLHRALPDERPRPLPPHLVTMELTRPTGLPERLGPPGRRALTAAGHFGYGAITGSLFALWQRALPAPPALSGALFGLAVWAASYLGWVPSLGLMRPATRQPIERNAMMIAAHVVWGVALGLLVERSRGRHRDWRRAVPLESSDQGIAPPRLADRIKG